jgi:hypothetical protein
MRDFLASFVRISPIPVPVGGNHRAMAWQVLGVFPRTIREERVRNRVRPRIVPIGSLKAVLEKSNTLQQMMPKETTVFLRVN